VDRGRGLDGSGRLRDSLDAIASEEDFILSLLRAANSDTRKHSHSADHLLSQIVADFDLAAILGHVNVDREMRVDETHLVLVSLKSSINNCVLCGQEGMYLGNTGDHVTDVRNNGADSSTISLLGKPELDLQGLVLGGASEEDINVQVLESTSEGSTRASDFHCAGVDLNLHWGNNNN
jgi:hypothetical protein